MTGGAVGAVSDVAVVVATRDLSATLGAALDSIDRAVSGAAPCRAEVVVIDASSPKEREATRRLVAGRPHVRWIAQDGTGLAAARNEGIGLTTAPLVAFCDADDAWTPDALRVRRDLLAEDPHAWGATGRVRFVDVRDADPGEGGRRVRRRAGSEHVGATPGAMLLRRDAIVRVGPFDTTLTVGTDADWIVRAERLLGPALAVDHVVLEKGLRPASLSTDTLTYRTELLTIARRLLADPGRRERP